MKDINIGEILRVENGVITPSFKYKSGSVNVFYDGKEVEYIETDDNSIMVIETENKVVNTVNGKAFSLICDDEGRLETIEMDIEKSFEVDLSSSSKYKINVNSDESIETTLNNRLNSITISPKTRLNDKRVVVKYLHSVDNDTIIFSKNNKVDSLFKAYGSESLKHNHVYTFTACVDGKNFSTDFVTKLNPYYSSVDKIRKDTGGLLESVDDDVISYLIYLNSKNVYEVLKEKEVEGIPNFAKQYVRYKTDMDLINAIYLTLSGKPGSTNKRIGIISVDKTMKIPFIKDMLYYFKDLCKKYEDMLDELGEVSMAGSFVKAKETTYPITQRMSF